MELPWPMERDSSLTEILHKQRCGGRALRACLRRARPMDGEGEHNYGSYAAETKMA